MKSTPKILMLMILTMAAVCFTSHPAAAQRGSQRITCSSNNGNRNWCDIGGNSDVRLVRQISGGLLRPWSNLGGAEVTGRQWLAGGSGYDA